MININEKLIYMMIFLPFMLVLLLMWVDSKKGLDNSDIEKNGDQDKHWLKQKITIGRNPHLEYYNHPTQAERWKILMVWLIPSVILFLILFFE